MAPMGFEPTTTGLKVQRSTRLSYGAMCNFIGSCYLSTIVGSFLKNPMSYGAINKNILKYFIKLSNLQEIL